MADAKKDRPRSLLKHHSWSPDINREEAWRRRRDLHRGRRRGGVADDDLDDLDELRACLELGFDIYPSSSQHAENYHISESPPPLDLFFSVHRSSSADPLTAENLNSSAPSPCGSSISIYSPGDSPRQVKTRLKHWAKVVACCVRQNLP